MFLHCLSWNRLQLRSIGTRCTCSGWSRLSAIFGNCFHYTTKNGTMKNTTIILISVYELISMCRCYNGGYTHSYSYTYTGLQPIRDISWKDTPPNHHRRFHIHTKSPSFCRMKDLKNLDPTMNPASMQDRYFCVNHQSWSTGQFTAVSSKSIHCKHWAWLIHISGRHFWRKKIFTAVTPNARLSPWTEKIVFTIKWTKISTEQKKTLPNESRRTWFH